MLEPRDPVEVITGAASDMGREFARYWTEHGGQAVSADLSEESLKWPPSSAGFTATRPWPERSSPYTAASARAPRDTHRWEIRDGACAPSRNPGSPPLHPPGLRSPGGFLADLAPAPAEKVHRAGGNARGTEKAFWS
jgi:NAD(P)-dependent dehydrogenase (short-subunit alcohol dehydrogenase family)